MTGTYRQSPLLTAVATSAAEGNEAVRPDGDATVQEALDRFESEFLPEAVQLFQDEGSVAAAQIAAKGQRDWNTLRQYMQRAVDAGMM